MVALSRFISKEAHRTISFFSLMRKGQATILLDGHICEESFQQPKAGLLTPSIFTRPKACDTLFLYLAVAKEVISAVLIREMDDR
ncbi:hypothetical protein CR513_42131, partial [Mucuna pruriens]